MDETDNQSATSNPTAACRNSRKIRMSPQNVPDMLLAKPFQLCDFPLQIGCVLLSSCNMPWLMPARRIRTWNAGELLALLLQRQLALA
jgi:hypothetical protein